MLTFFFLLLDIVVPWNSVKFLWNFFGYLVFCTMFNMNLDLVVVYGVNRNCSLILVYFLKNCVLTKHRKCFPRYFSEIQSNTKKRNCFLVEKYFMLETNHLFQRKKRRNKKTTIPFISTVPSFFRRLQYPQVGNLLY